MSIDKIFTNLTVVLVILFLVFHIFPQREACSVEYSDVKTQLVPPIDKNIPDNYETATFALG